MRNNGKLLIFIGIFLFGIFLVPSLGVSGENILIDFESKVTGEEIDTATKTRQEFSIWDSIRENEQQCVNFKTVINGYIVDINSGEITPDLRNKSLMEFNKDEKEFYLKFEIIDSIYIFELKETIGSLFISKNDEYYLVYNFDNPKNSFFTDFIMNKVTCIGTVVFVQNEQQFNYHFSIELEKTNFKPFLPNKFEPSIVVDAVNNSKVLPGSYSLALEDLNSITIHKNSQPETKSSFTYYYYGLSYECYDFYLDYPGDLPNDYWTYSAIDIGIHRMNPAESQVKSDIQTYCRQDYWDHGFSGTIRKVLAFSMVTHGGPYYNIYDGDQEYIGVIYPSEIESLWYWEFPGPSTFHWIIPDDCICMADLCYGYYEPPSSDPTMAEAWVDEPEVGADSYVGAIIGVPTNSDPFMSAFWYDLCQDDNNVGHAVDDLCDAAYDWNEDWNWTRGEEWRIYGSSTATLQN